MKTSIFLSYPKPFNSSQECFIKQLGEYLHNRRLEPRTLGVTDYDIDAPLKAIRRLMLESNGLITVAFRRTFISNATIKPNSKESRILNDVWLTSPYSHIEPAMAFQIGLPILILREQGVVEDGILEKGVVGTYMPEFGLDDTSLITDYFNTEEWKQMIRKWECYVARVAENKGTPLNSYFS